MSDEAFENWTEFVLKHVDLLSAEQKVTLQADDPRVRTELRRCFNNFVLYDVTADRLLGMFGSPAQGAGLRVETKIKK